ncbi:uncharacterized protein LOC116429013 [Nomia melanderi]|uniref:uncharacterized protein LOC116429013 n=1 Tax=Nomia melanderi TaxID=2448451 RepID=UPI0013041422|nr:uncharacterized protein LOC116429013 [Nomia melanderi]
MRTSLVLLVSIVASATAAPLREIAGPDARISPRGKDEEAPVPAEAEIVTGRDATNQPAKKQSEKSSGGTNDSRSGGSLPAANLSKHARTEGKPDSAQSASKLSNDARERVSKKNRRHKAIFVNYPIVPQLPFSNIPYDVDYTGNSFDAEDDGKRYDESNIFYIRLPPTPYMFVPGLGYISQPPTYSTSSLRPQISYNRPARPKPVYQQPVNPFIKLPIDFVSNGKPTSVYQWQKKTAGKKPTDSPIMNLDSLSNEFVSNGKPTSIYQWQTNLKPAKRPEDNAINNLDKGPYTFNGKPASFFLLKPDGTNSIRQPLRYPDYQQDNSYY